MVQSLGRQGRGRALEEARQQRRSEARTIDRKRIAQGHQERALFYGHSSRDLDAPHHPRCGGAELVFHLHRLHHHQSLPGVNLVPDVHIDAHDETGHWRAHGCRPDRTGGGAVRVTANGQMRITSVRVDQAMLSTLVETNNADDRAMAEDLIAGAVNAALQKAKEAASEHVSEAARELTLPIPPGGLGGLLG